MNHSQHTLPDCNNAIESSTEWVPQIFSGARESQPCDPQVENCKTTRSDLLSHSADQSWGPGPGPGPWSRPVPPSSPACSPSWPSGGITVPRSPGLRRLGRRLSHPAARVDGSPACVEGSLGLQPEPGVSQGRRVELSSCGERWCCPIFPGGCWLPLFGGCALH